MAFAHEKRTAARLLGAIENGSLSPEDTLPLLKESDPALVYLIVAWLRARYHPGHSASEGVLGRIVHLCTESPAVARMVQTGGSDPIVAWFEQSHNYRDVDRSAFIDTIVEKLEG